MKSSKPPLIVRKDPLHNDVPVPPGHMFKVGRNQEGVAVKRGSQTVEDEFGQIHEIPIGSRAIHNPDGTVTVARHGESPNTNKLETPTTKPPAFEKSAKLKKPFIDSEILESLTLEIWNRREGDV